MAEERTPASTIGVPLCEALGLDPSRVTKLVLTIGPDGGAYIDVSGWLTDIPKGLTQMITQFELKPREVDDG